MAQHIKVRAATRDDWPLIINSWLKSNRRSPLAAHLRSGIYFERHAELVRDCLRRNGAMVAYPDVAGAGDEIAGWLCSERADDGRLIVHYIYTVGRAYRRMGVARTLLEAAGWRPGDEIVATHITHVYTDWKDVRMRYRITNDPYRLYGANGAQT